MPDVAQLISGLVRQETGFSLNPLNISVSKAELKVTSLCGPRAAHKCSYSSYHAKIAFFPCLPRFKAYRRQGQVLSTF